MQKSDIEKNDTPILLKLNKTYIIKYKGKEQQWEPFRIYTDKEGRKGYMGTTHRGVLLAITNYHEILGEVEADPILYSEWRAAGTERCIVCGNLYVANSVNFPTTYSDRETRTTPICIHCLQTELKSADKERREIISKAIYTQYRSTRNRNIIAFT